jgi:hypothetical protein
MDLDPLKIYRLERVSHDCLVYPIGLQVTAIFVGNLWQLNKVYGRTPWTIRNLGCGQMKMSLGWKVIHPWGIKKMPSGYSTLLHPPIDKLTRSCHLPWLDDPISPQPNENTAMPQINVIENDTRINDRRASDHTSEDLIHLIQEQRGYIKRLRDMDLNSDYVRAEIKKHEANAVALVDILDARVPAEE